MDSILGGGTSGNATSSTTGGIGGLLEQLAGGTQGGTSTSGGLGDLLGGLAGGASAGGLGSVLGGLAGQLGGAAQKDEGSFGDVLSSQFDNTPEPAKQPSANPC